MSVKMLGSETNTQIVKIVTGKSGRELNVQIYTRSLRPELYELFKIALFLTTHMGQSRKNQHLGRSLSIRR